MATCPAHPTLEAVYDCTGCARPMCRVCAVWTESGYTCRDCRARQQQAASRRWMLGAGVGLGIGLPVAAAVASVAGYAIATYEPPYDYGEDAATVQRLEGELASKPCDHATMLDLAETMLAAGDNAGTRARIDRYIGGCGEDLRLRWLTYEAYKRESKYELAAAEATRLVDDQPLDQDFRWWRGLVLEHAGDLAGAARDYRQSTILMPDEDSIPFNLADVELRRDQGCDGLDALRRYQWFHPDAASDPMFARYVARMNATGRCPTGGGSTDLEPGDDGRLHAAATFGTTVADAIVDPSVGEVLVDAALAAKAGLVEDRADTYVIAVGDAPVKAWAARSPTLAIGDATSPDVPVLVVEKLGAEAIIGQTFLARFREAWVGDVLSLDGPTSLR
jgi:hypothetical protein